MADPALNLQVTADITALMTSMQAAQNAVNQTTADMSSALGKVPKDIAVNVDTSSINAAAAAVNTIPKDVQVTADVGGLQAAMQAAAQSAADASAKIGTALGATPKQFQQAADASRLAATTVEASTAKMTDAVERMSLGQRFAKQMEQVNKAAMGLNLAMGGVRSATLAATGDIEGALNALPGPFGMVAGAAFQLGGAIHEAFTGAKAALAEFEAEVKKIEGSSDVKAQTREYERLLAIEKELDPIRKLELERQNALAKARREMLEMTKEIGGAEAAAMQAARERLINAQYDNKIREANERLAKQTAEADERSAKMKEQAAKIEPPKQTAMQALVSSVTTSLGGSFNFAQNPVLKSIQDYAIKQAGHQANLVLTAKEILQVLRTQGATIT